MENVTGQKSKIVKSQIKNGKSQISCPNCGSTDVIRDSSRAELICQQCGMVLDDRRIDHGPDWRSFSKEERDKRVRAGAPADYTRSYKGLSTSIGWRNRDAAGRKLSSRNRAEIIRLRKWQRRTRMHSNMHRNLAKAMFELDRLIGQLRLPDSVKEAAALLYRRLLREEITRGRIIKGVINACVYLACRLHNIPRTMKEIAKKSRVSEKDIGRYSRLITEALNLYIPPIKATALIPRFAEALNLDGNVRQRALELLNTARKDLITVGKAPNGLAASSLYIASILEGDSRTQREIADIAGVTEVTIRARYKELVDELNISLE